MVDSTTTLTLKDAFGALKIFGEVTDGTNVYPIVSLRMNSAAVSASNPLAVVSAAGTAIIGKVSIDQTTPGTTNAVAPINGQAGVAGGSGVVGATVQRITLATDDSFVAAAASTKVGVRQRFFDASFSTLTRPANTTAYAVNDSISDNGTAGSVTALFASPGDVNDDPLMITHVRLDTSDTGLGNGVTVRVHMFNTDPTLSTGVGGGDNAAWSQKKAGWFGSLSGTFKLFSDGGRCVCVPEDGTYLIAPPSAGTVKVFYQIQTLTAFTPSANSTTIDGRVKGFQGRA